MAKEFVKVLMDIHCDWHGTAPGYRVFVNEELFSERTYIWTEQYVTEALQVNAEPGLYQVRLEYLNAEQAVYSVQNRRTESGPGRWINNSTVEIGHAS